MTLPFNCILIAFLLAYFSKNPVAIAMRRQPGGYDNKHPRDQQAQLTGWGRRALGAHQNHFEAFPFFAAAVFIAYLGHGNPAWSARLAVIFVLCRVVYNILYIANWDRLRSSIWMIGWLCTLGLMVLGIGS